jgi:hypothetical protein
LTGSIRSHRQATPPQVVAIALLLRHSRCPRDLTRTLRRLALPPQPAATGPDSSPSPRSTTQDAPQPSRPSGRRCVRSEWRRS